MNDYTFQNYYLLHSKLRVYYLRLYFRPKRGVEKSQWNGHLYNSITGFFKEEFRIVPSIFFRPEFDSVLTKLWILFKFRGQASCDNAIEQLINNDRITNDSISNWNNHWQISKFDQADDFDSLVNIELYKSQSKSNSRTFFP